MKQSELLKNYANLDLKKLEQFFKRNGFFYHLVIRTESKCMYRQDLGNRVISFEVFKTKIVLLRKFVKALMARKNLPLNESLYEEYSEKFPRDEEFGKRAWTFRDYEDALKKYEELP